ncbi:hypothetical protein JL721_8083 [Aureococcus anophagefferens]|nr:hypothetical protein JL721_8083 [Aureococcus anophagefferens]
MTFGAVGPAFYDFLVAHGVDDPFDTWFLLYIGWPAPTMTLDRTPVTVRGVNFAASLVAYGAVACYVPGAGTCDPGGARAAGRRAAADLLVAHVAALVGAAARDATEEDARAISGALRPTVDEFNGRATLHAFVHDQFAEHGMRKCYGSPPWPPPEYAASAPSAAADAGAADDATIAEKLRALGEAQTQSD